MESPIRFWRAWLIVVTLGVAVFGLTLVLAPALGRQIFGLLIFRSKGNDAHKVRLVDYH